MSSVEETFVGQVSTFMRKSLENVVSGSHDAIGSSISQALAFTNAMTLPSNNNDTPTTESQQIQQNVLSTSQIELHTQRSHSPTNKSVQSKLSSPSANSMPEQDSTANLKLNNESLKSLVVNRSTSQKSTKSGTSGGSISPNEKKENTNGDKSEKSENKGEKEKKKKKSSWLNVLYPTYKSRSEDFKRLFKDVPDDERLVVDYSCALQKEILVHGRMFVSQNFLCFHANIFGWETTVCLKWKDVTSITKEKTALVIPNAILVCTQTDKMFFTSFGTRDKAYLMLFRVWQNALMGKQMGQQEMWQWVHFCYGDELGLTSDDEDYIPPNNEDDKLTVGQRLSVESIIEDPVTPTSVPDGISIPEIGVDDKKIIITPRKKKKSISRATSPTDSSETDGEKKVSRVNETSPPSSIDSLRKDVKPKLIIPVCVSPHEGRSIINVTIPMHVDSLFTLLFTENKFLMDFHDTRRTTDYLATPWAESPNGEKTRTVTSTVALNASVGPKVANVTETQILSSVTAPGLYVIDVEAVNANIPYADSFYILTHYCLSYVSERESRLQIYAQIKYRKSIWGLVKGMIEKNCWAGMEDFFQSLSKALIRHTEEIVEPKVPSKRKAPRPPRKRTASTQPVEFIEVPQGTIIATSGNILETQPTTTVMNNKNSTIHLNSTWFIIGIVIFLLLVNAMLYVKLVALEDEAKLSNSQIDFNYFKEQPTNYNEWIEILYTQEKIHLKETNKYKKVLKQTIELLKKAEEALVKLQLDLTSDPNSAFSHISTVISSLEDTVTNSKKQ